MHTDVQKPNTPTGMICCRSSSVAVAMPTRAIWSHGAVGGVRSFLKGKMWHYVGLPHSWKLWVKWLECTVSVDQQAGCSHCSSSEGETLTCNNREGGGCPERCCCKPPSPSAETQQVKEEELRTFTFTFLGNFHD